MDWQDEFLRKQITIDELFERYITGNGQKVFTGGLHIPHFVVLEMLNRIRDIRLWGIQQYGGWTNGDVPFRDLAVSPEQFRYHTFFAGPNERGGFATGSKCVVHVPTHFSDTNRMLYDMAMDVAVVQMTPPDEDGWCNIGPVGFEQGALRGAKNIVAQINSKLPRVRGDEHDWHVSQIDAFILHDEPLQDIPVAPPTKEEQRCAAHIVERVNDGDTIQLGVGGILNAVAEGLETKQHLGAYTEMYSLAYVKLQKQGVIDNSRKRYYPGVSVAGYSTDSNELYDFINENPEVYYSSYENICNPVNIARNENLVSVNTAISIDLTGQVCAESIGSHQYSASGGQFDFVRGVKNAPGGRGFIAVTSVAHTKRGPVSKIVPVLAPGSAVTSLRNDLQYVVTEYGIADLRWADLPTRAARLIKIAHPDFRDELTYEAKRLGFLY